MNLFICFFLLKIFVFHDVYGFLQSGLRWEDISPYPANITLKNYEQWFTQKVDHKNPSDSRTWNQRYFINKRYYRQGGPIFIFISGENEASAGFITQGAMVDVARALGGLCFLLEHRYYGRSQPIRGDLRYLTTEQALEDVANFIVGMNKKHNLQRSKWVAYGGSYAGNLAAWIRLKHPELVTAAVSSSSPLLAQVDYSDYYKVVGEDIKYYNKESYAAVQQAFAAFENAMKSQNGIQSLNQKFKLCTNLQNSVNKPHDIASLFLWLISGFATVQYYRKNSGAQLAFDRVCDIMADRNRGPPLDRLAAVVNLVLQTYEKKCLGYAMDRGLPRTNGRGRMADYKAWLYQTCTEYGYYQTTSAPPQVFGNKVPLNFYIQRVCQAMFGQKYNLQYVTNAVQKTNSNYGGKNIQVTKVVFVQGSMDPWYPAGLTETLNPQAPVIFIEGVSHCADLASDLPDDLPQLKSARRKIQEYITSWLQQ